MYHQAFERNLNFACSLLGKVNYIDEEPTNYIEFVKPKSILVSRFSPLDSDILL